MHFTENEIATWPFGEALKSTLPYAAVQNLTLKNRFSILDFGTLTGNTTLNVTQSGELPTGSLLLLKVRATANGNDLTLGNGIDAPNIVGVAGKTKTQLFIYDGTVYLPAGAAVQVD